MLFDATFLATDVVFVTPLYWYSVSASMKLYLDYWSAWFRVPGADFRKRMAGKTAWAVTAYSDEGDEQLHHAISEHVAHVGRLHGNALGRNAGRLWQPPRRRAGGCSGCGAGEGFFWIVGCLRIWLFEDLRI
ncbi:MAG: NAD(P)H-dependent oxidoreductase [Haliscomenobacter sp.]|nr:NAD(P)H-dependent oxidoreductase [Haliscomenobacter sp.]